jgi:cytolysin (calcineurin-like family phosphatase)
VKKHAMKTPSDPTPATQEILDAIARLHTDMDAGFAMAGKQFERIELRFTGIDARFTAVDARFDRIENTMATKADIHSLERRIARLDDRVSHLESTRS